MTTNGDGTLYFLSAGGMPTLYDTDPTNASVLSMSTIMAPGGGNPALAFWGGSFYVFANNMVTQYDPKAKTSKSLGMAPLQVIAAGQSTCVPTTP